MATPAKTLDERSGQSTNHSGRSLQDLPLAILANIGINIFILIGSVAASISIFMMDDFFRLGRPVQYFAAVITLIPAILAAYGIPLLLRVKPGGRYISMGLTYTGAVLSSIYLLHLWNIYVGFDDIATAFFENAVWLAGIAFAYGLYWIASKLGDDTQIQRLIDRVALIVAALSLALFLWNADLISGLGNVLESYTQPATWLVTLVIIILATCGYSILRLGEYFGETPAERTAWQGWLMLSPNLIGFSLFLAGPLLLSLYLSFTNSRPRQIPEVIGFENYIDLMRLDYSIQGLNETPQRAIPEGYSPLITIEIDQGFLQDTLDMGPHRVVIGANDKLFWVSMRNTFMFAILLLPLSIIPALLLATILDSQIPGMKFFRAVYFLPSVAAVVGTATIWRLALYSTAGANYINFALNELIDVLNILPLVDMEAVNVGWLSDSNYQLLSIVIMAAWQIVGFNTVLFLAGLQGIPKVLYEAARVDGAGLWGQFRNVTLPLLAPTTFFVVVTTLINALQVFNEPFVLFPASPRPENATTGVLNLYNIGFFEQRFGRASAFAWLLFIVIFLVTLLQFRLSRSDAYES